MICHYSCKFHFKALAFLYSLPLTSIKYIYISCQSSDHFRKLTIIVHKYKIPCKPSAGGDNFERTLGSDKLICFRGC